MYYYKVLVGDLQYHGQEALTYANEGPLRSGAVVRIALRNRQVLGVVESETSEPSFAAKTISGIAPSEPVPPQILTLMSWLSSYYPAPLGAIVRQFLPSTVAFPKDKTTHDSYRLKPVIRTEATLNSDQADAVSKLDTKGYHLLHGITGSGKTRVYYELAKMNIARGKSVIILTPEIGLTSQLAASFASITDAPIRVIHSRLKQSQRRDIWYEIANYQGPQVIIGPRSALFSPAGSVGLIVVDESHDQSYKNDSSPNYRSDRVAAKLAALHGATMVSGSATPTVEEYFVASAKNLPIVNMSKKAIENDAVLDVQVVDMRDSDEYSKSRIISNSLLGITKDTLTRGEQTLLFLNRRGTANVILCTSCGWQELCNHCDLPLTYHADSHSVRCHVCGRRQSARTSCPDCGHTEIVFRSIGTKAVVDEVKKFFPDAKIYRFDSDTNKSEQLENMIDELKNGKADIIIGTQMIAKGLDLPKLATVGVINADGGLAVPDFAASERTLQLLTQVAGRVGRGHTKGTLCIQTYQPTNKIVLSASRQDWQGFYEHELQERKAYSFPPYCYLLKLSCTRASSTAAETAAVKLAAFLQDEFGAHIEGPSPAFHPKEDGKYKWQFIVKSTSRKKLLSVIEALPSGWTHDIDPINLL